ncbi:unnamed protein product [Durusdinium trenchii]|uniref:Uncharacterized protein n=1 Tax=Durusdinium trenchii TaxID=1381693 RepID=A0ABP0PWI9_9DINO
MAPDESTCISFRFMGPPPRSVRSGHPGWSGGPSVLRPQARSEGWMVHGIDIAGWREHVRRHSEEGKTLLSPAVDDVLPNMVCQLVLDAFLVLEPNWIQTWKVTWNGPRTCSSLDTKSLRSRLH